MSELFCKDCMHYPELVKPEPYCQCHHQQTKVDLVNGPYLQKLTCRTHRESQSRHTGYGLCGPDAKWFEPKPVPGPGFSDLYPKSIWFRPISFEWIVRWFRS